MNILLSLRSSDLPIRELNPRPFKSMANPTSKPTHHHNTKIIGEKTSKKKNRKLKKTCYIYDLG